MCLSATLRWTLGFCLTPGPIFGTIRWFVQQVLQVELSPNTATAAEQWSQPSKHWSKVQQKLLAKIRINNDKYKWSQNFDKRLHPKNFPFPKGIWALHLIQVHGSLGPPCPYPKQHLDRFISFSTAQAYVNRQTHTSRNIGIYCTGCISALCACDVA